ncbi:MAG: transposase [bacterium]|nr:transposase [bacterium]
MPRRKKQAAAAAPKESAAQLIKTVRRQTRTKYSAEDKIRIVLEGLRGDHPVAALCRREGVSANVYYNWLKEFMEAGKARLKGGGEKKSLLKRKAKRYARHTSEQKQDLLRLVDSTPLSIRRCLKRLKLPKSTYYRWQNQGTLADRSSAPRRVWNRLLEEEESTIIANALPDADLSPRQLAFRITDDGGFSVSESTVYRILKRNGLARELPQIIPAAKEYHRKTTRVNERWQTDLTELMLPDWGHASVGQCGG